MDESRIAKVVPSTIDLNMEYQVEDSVPSTIDLNMQYQVEDSEYDSSDMDFDINLEPDFIRDEVNENVDVLRDDDDTNGTNETHPILEKLAPPSVGMNFASSEDVIEYYHEFGKQNGFQMKIRSRENVKGTECGNKYDCTRLRLVCKKEGKFVPRGRIHQSLHEVKLPVVKPKLQLHLTKVAGNGNSPR